jgi:drug/metabolite transporter (DMT)-like permease
VTDVTEQAPSVARSLPATVALCGVCIAALAGLGMALLVLFTNPDTRVEELFIGFLLALATGLGTAAFLAFSRRTASPLADSFRAFRRGLLFGLAWSGAAILQLNGALSPTNLGFLLLVLLIVETIFLARRQHPM